MNRVDLPVPLMHRDPDRSWITDPDLDHPRGKQPIHVSRDKKCSTTLYFKLSTKVKMFNMTGV